MSEKITLTEGNIRGQRKGDLKSAPSPMQKPTGPPPGHKPSEDKK